MGKASRVTFLVATIGLIIYAIEKISETHPFVGTGILLLLVTTAIIGSFKND